MRRPYYRRAGMPLQKYLADPRRNDGFSTDGFYGDCLRTAIAGALGFDRDDVPHFVQYTDDAWWWELQRWFREMFGGAIHPCTPEYFLEGYTSGHYMRGPTHTPWVVLTGPSPRGPWGHAVVGNLETTQVHDPHPLGMGLLSIEEVYYYHPEPTWPLPPRRALTGGNR